MPDQQQDPNITSQQTTPEQGETPATWDTWYATQPENVKALYEQHVTGLKNTVQATREERDTLAKQIRDLSTKAEKGSELEKTLTEFTGKLALAEQRAAFYEDAGKPEIGCRNPKAAFALAQADNLFDRRGQPDWNAIKAAAPELFGAPSVNANAGTGTQNKPPQANTMNDFIRGRGRS